jgi:hypothetical protein
MKDILSFRRLVVSEFTLSCHPEHFDKLNVTPVEGLSKGSKRSSLQSSFSG